MVRALRADFDQVRSSLVRFGLDLTLADELLGCKSSLTERNVIDTAARLVAISRLAALLENSGIELPQRSIPLEAEWHADRLGRSIVA